MPAVVRARHESSRKLREDGAADDREWALEVSGRVYGCSHPHGNKQTITPYYTDYYREPLAKRTPSREADLTSVFHSGSARRTTKRRAVHADTKRVSTGSVIDLSTSPGSLTQF